MKVKTWLRGGILLMLLYGTSGFANSEKSLFGFAQSINHQPFERVGSEQGKKKAMRIKFTPNSFSQVVTGKLHGFDSQRSYLVKARKGQKLVVEHIDRSKKQLIATSVSSPSGKVVSNKLHSCDGRHTVSSTGSGDYEINVAQCAKAEPWSGSFSLKVTLR